MTNFDLDDLANKLNIILEHSVGMNYQSSSEQVQNLSSKYHSILNLDGSSGNGIHWVCWFKEKNNKYYFWLTTTRRDN